MGVKGFLGYLYDFLGIGDIAEVATANFHDLPKLFSVCIGIDSKFEFGRDVLCFCAGFIFKLAGIGDGFRGLVVRVRFFFKKSELKHEIVTQFWRAQS